MAAPDSESRQSALAMERGFQAQLLQAQRTKESGEEIGPEGEFNDEGSVSLREAAQQAMLQQAQVTARREEEAAAQAGSAASQAKQAAEGATTQAAQQAYGLGIQALWGLYLETFTLTIIFLDIAFFLSLFKTSRKILKLPPPGISWLPMLGFMGKIQKVTGAGGGESVSIIGASAAGAFLLLASMPLAFVIVLLILVIAAVAYAAKQLGAAWDWIKGLFH